MSDIPQEFTEELARLSLELAKTRVAIERLITDQASEIDWLRTALERIKAGPGKINARNDPTRAKIRKSIIEWTVAIADAALKRATK